MTQTNLTDPQIDQLKEITNIGAGNASTALSKLLNTPVSISVPSLQIQAIETATDTFGQIDQIICMVLVELKGEIPGFMLLIFSETDTLKILNLLTNKNKTDIKQLDDFDRSALREVGNILSGASFTALSKFLNTNIVQSVPDIAIDMLGAVVSSLVSVLGSQSEQILISQSSFSLTDKLVSGQLFYFFSPDSTQKILNTLQSQSHV